MDLLIEEAEASLEEHTRLYHVALFATWNGEKKAIEEGWRYTTDDDTAEMRAMIRSLHAALDQARSAMFECRRQLELLHQGRIDLMSRQIVSAQKVNFNPTLLCTTTTSSKIFLKTQQSVFFQTKAFCNTIG